MTLVMNHVARAVRRSRALNPLSLFANGEQGAWFDYSDFSTMFQDATGTIPVTAVGQPVGKILDKSGNGHHATQSTATARPILQQDENGNYYLLLDGIDDFLVTGNIDFTITDKITVWAGIRKLRDIDRELIVGISPFITNPGSFEIEARGGALPDGYNFALSATAITTLFSIDNNYISPITNIVSCVFDIGQPTRETEMLPRINGDIPSLGPGAATEAGTGNFGNHELRIGMRGSGELLPFNGHIYGLVVRGAASTEAEIAAIETWMNGKTGAY